MTLPAWLERQRALLDFTLASLGRRPGKNLSLLAVYALVVFAVASTLFFTEALRAEAAVVLRGAPDVVVQRLAAGRHDLIPSGEVERLAAIRGVARAVGRRWGYLYRRASQANLTVLVPEGFPGAEGEVVVGEGVARLEGVAAGSPLWLEAASGERLRFTVRQVMAPETSLVGADLLLVGEGDFQRLLGAEPERFTDIALTVPNAREIPKVAEKVLRAVPGARAITRLEMARTYQAIFDWRSGLVMVVLCGALLAFGLVAWDKAAGLSAEERREIGILKAIGWDVDDVLLVKLWEGAVISATAFVVGVVAAYLHVFVGSAALLAPVLQGWSVLTPRWQLTPAPGGMQLATLFFLTVVPYTVATVVPAWRAATADPDAVMRS
jgi:ABC-type lipoprotein release transport system permease subunit